MNLPSQKLKGALRLLLCTALLALCVPFVYSQETTGNIQGTVKDPNGAVVPNATVTATNPQRSYTATTNEGGDYNFNNLPPGMYTVEVTSAGFSTVTRKDVPVELGRTLQVNFDLTIGNVGETVNITAADEPIVDVTSTKTATNITQQKIELLPKTLRFDSVVQVAPGVRNETKGGGFQIDGASGSENTWIIDGLDVTRVFDGVLGNSKDIPFDFVREVQVKSAGYEAEFGGATGGVINVVTRSGSNEFHGEGRLEMALDNLNAADRPTRRFERLALARPAATRAFVPEYFFNNQGKDDFRLVAPTFDLGGPILKNKLWFYGSYAPQFEHTTRILRLIAPITSTSTAITQLDQRPIEYRTKYDYLMGRIDYTPIQQLTFNVTAINSPIKVHGPPNFLAFETTSTTTFNNIRYPLQGGYTPANQVSGNATWTVTPNLVINGRLGRNYLNDKGGSYDVPNSPLYSISGPCTTSISGGLPCPEGSTANGAPNAFTSNSQTLFNITTRKTFNIDATWTKRILGQQHSIKGGYQGNWLANRITAGSAAGSIVVHYGQTSPSCNCMGTYGYYQLNTSGQRGSVSSRNQGVYIQDAWQVHPRVTLNLGLRSENEFVPSYPLDASGHPGLDVSQLSVDPKAPIRFGWGDKLAPRLGGAWDVKGDGKLKIYASYSVFFDTMKYNLPRGSFGGEVFVQTERKLDTLDFRSLSLENQPGALIIQRDLRVPALQNVPGPGGAIFHAVDPNLKPVREHEFTVGGDYAINRDTVFSARFTDKNLDRTIEDIGLVFFAADGVTVQEQYMIGNPGFGTSVTDFKAFGHPPTTKAIRNYKGLELRVDKRFSNHWYINTSYLRSRLFGNYSGLSSSDETGRNAANTNRYFDMPWITYDAHGKLSNGLLATDRPNTFKAFGAYRFQYGMFGKRMETEIGGSQFIYQGTPITTHVNIEIEGTVDGLSNFVPSFVNGRGDLGRTPVFTQTDGLVTQRFNLTENVRLNFQFNVLNVFNQDAVTDRSGSIIRTASSTVSSGNEYNNPAAFATYTAPTFAQAVQLYVTNPGDWQTHLGVPLSSVQNPFYNLPTAFQAPRNVRFSIGVQF
jgi:Carboxypeptidase regulatory-like domain/TonB-dependent Receptor Plug Domain